MNELKKGDVVWLRDFEDKLELFILGYSHKDGRFFDILSMTGEPLGRYHSFTMVKVSKEEITAKIKNMLMACEALNSSLRSNYND